MHSQSLLLLAGLVFGCARSPEPIAPAPAPEPPPEAPVVSADAAPPAEPAKPKAFELDGGKLVTAPVQYQNNSAELLPASREALDHVADYLEAKPEITRLRIEVHTDKNGPDDQKVTQRRSVAVARWLVNERGIDCRRLIPTGFGSSMPIAPNDTPENRARNRRTLFVNAELKGKTIGGMPVDGGGKIGGDPCAK